MRDSRNSLKTPGAFSAIHSDDESSSDSENEDNFFQELPPQKPASPEILTLANAIEKASVMDISSENVPPQKTTTARARRAIQRPVELASVKRKNQDRDTTPSPTEINDLEITTKRRPADASPPNPIITKSRRP